MSSMFGNNIRVSIFGESHGKSIGVLIDGIGAGEDIDMQGLLSHMQRRRPGGNELGTRRNEEDIPIIISGITDGVTNGYPISIIINNSDTRSEDYKNLVNVPRPGHCDYSAYIRYNGYADMRGSGHFSGRLTAPICIAGGIAKQVLARRNIYVGAHIKAVEDIEDESYPLYPSVELLESVINKTVAVLDDSIGVKISNRIKEVAKSGDSVGGIIECALIGMQAGLGNPMFEGIESALSKAIFGIPAVKGLEFGSGFLGCKSRGSINNDSYDISNDEIVTRTNNHGGILGGISTGMPILMRVGIKPTPSISIRQQSINLSTMQPEELTVNGRHDPCIAIRAVPVIESVVACVMMDIMSHSLWR